MSSPKRTFSKDENGDAVSPPKRIASPQKSNAGVISPPLKVSPLVKVASPPTKGVSPMTVSSPPAKVISPQMQAVSPPSKAVSPPAPKLIRTDSRPDEMAAVAPRGCREQPTRDAPFRPEKLSLVAAEADGPNESADLPPENANPARADETNGVGDKIKIFEKAAEDAATAGRVSRPGSMRRPRAERLPSDELPPPPSSAEPSPPAVPPERIASLAPRRPRPDGDASDAERPRIVRPEFRLASPAEITIRSPSLGAKAPERFPSRGTAFRNVAAAPQETPDDAEDKACKSRGRATASRGSSYFTRGSEEIWLVKKKDIEEIEERVFDSFRRAGVRGGATPNAGAARGRRGYARSESLEPTRGGEWAGRAQTLKRQASVACTCGHDKKTRPRHADTTPRPRSRSHGDPGDAAVLDKYETLV